MQIKFKKYKIKIYLFKLKKFKYLIKIFQIKTT